MEVPLYTASNKNDKENSDNSRKTSFSTIGQFTPVVSAANGIPPQVMNKVSQQAKTMILADPGIAESLRKSKLSLSEMVAEVEEKATLEVAKQKREESLRLQAEQAKNYHQDYKAKHGIKPKWDKATRSPSHKENISQLHEPLS